MPTIDHLVGRRHCTPALAHDVTNMVLSCPPCNNEREVRPTSLEFVDLTPDERAYVNDP